MRILAITNMYPSPGAPVLGVFVEEQINGLLSIGLQVRVVFIDRRREGAMAYYRMAPTVRAAVKEFDPDLVHVLYGGVMADQITRWADIPPTIVTFHGSDLLGENLSGLGRKLISHYGVYCSRRAAQRARGVVLVARHLISALPGSIDQKKLRVIPCGINLDRFKPMNPTECRKQLGWSEDAFHVLFASGNNDPVKRPWLAKAAVEQAAREGIPAMIHCLTGVAYSKVPVWINASDVLLLTSLHEGSPTIVKESLASGVPVVSVNVGDVAERIDGIDGCHLAKPESLDLALKLRHVFKRRSRLDKMTWIDDFSHVTVARKLKQYYQEILDSPGSAITVPTAPVDIPLLVKRE